MPLLLVFVIFIFEKFSTFPLFITFIEPIIFHERLKMKSIVKSLKKNSEIVGWSNNLKIPKAIFSKGLIHSAQNKNTRIDQYQKNRFFCRKTIEKAVFKVEIHTDFNFYVCFLAALSVSGVPLYADEIWDHDFCILMTQPLCFI